ncbi:Cysteine proteinases superfamily protein [Striga hermonthica]|uniref:Cysteine proteinases superfamily protein n=1 Tax=Striga hermonthica TaxID=68872 RepID=A0A9N7R258_STRHE|nr:Cysteine proteinases superfamily protein [Striga hermonthica]
MVKRRSATGKKNYVGGGGGGSNNCRHSDFDFADEDQRVEAESQRFLAKFRVRSPCKKTAHNRRPLDKYYLLEFFAQEATQQKDYGSEKQQNSEHSTCHTKSRGPAGRKGYKTGTKHNKVLCVDSDEDGQMDLRSSSSVYVEENQGSSKRQSSDYEANNNDCESVVVVSPSFVKYANKHYTSCHLIFSQRCIRLEISPGEGNKDPSLEWPTCDIMKIEHQQCKSAKAEFVNLLLKSKYIVIADTGNQNSGSVQLEFVVHDSSEWPGKLAGIKSLGLKYEAAWETIINECNFDESFEGVVYPDGDPDAVFITREDIELLQPKTFINDTIIDFYIKYLVNNSNKEKQRRFHFFNTFFFQKLLDMDRDLSRDCENNDAFQRVRKWTRNINIFEKDYIFIPVNFSLHWSLIVICYPGEVANLRGMMILCTNVMPFCLFSFLFPLIFGYPCADKDLDSITKVPCILHMDSLRGSHGGLENLIKSYLWEEWKERGYKQENDISQTFLNLDFIELQLPQQENLFDCGLFLLHYAELFLELNIDSTKYANSLNHDWFLAAEVSLKKRHHIKKLIHGIAKDRKNRNEQFQSGGRNQGDSNSSDEFEIKEQQSFSAKFKNNRSVNKDKHDKLLPPINLFRKMTLPMEDTIGNHKASLPAGDHTSNRYKTGGDYNYISGKMEVSGETSSSGTRIIIDMQNEGDCVSEVASSFGRQGKRHGSLSISSDDLETCVVDDSEEESETENTRRARKPSLLIQ